MNKLILELLDTPRASVALFTNTRAKAMELVKHYKLNKSTWCGEVGDSRLGVCLVFGRDCLTTMSGSVWTHAVLDTSAEFNAETISYITSKVRAPRGYKGPLGTTLVSFNELVEGG